MTHFDLWFLVGIYNAVSPWLSFYVKWYIVLRFCGCTVYVNDELMHCQLNDYRLFMRNVWTTQRSMLIKNSTNGKDKFYLKSGTSTTNNISSMSYCPTVK